MSWMPDEQYEFVKDSRDKKNVARSARNKRTHCGKGGAVKFPSDFMSKKELEAMNGEVKSYKLNDPMTWDEFKSMPDDLKVMYIKALRDKYNVPDKAIADMMGASPTVFGRWIRCLGLGLGKSSGGTARSWAGTEDHDKFLAWCNGVKHSETSDTQSVEDQGVEAVAESETEPETSQDSDGNVALDNTASITDHTSGGNVAGYGFTYTNETKNVVPVNGDMTFEGNIDDILRTISFLLNGENVRLHVGWTVLNDSTDCGVVENR